MAAVRWSCIGAEMTRDNGHSCVNAILSSRVMARHASRKGYDFENSSTVPKITASKKPALSEERCHFEENAFNHHWLARYLPYLTVVTKYDGKKDGE